MSNYEQLMNHKAMIERELREFTDPACNEVECSAKSPPFGASRASASNEEIVRHHNTTPDRIQRISAIRLAARNMLDAIDANCPSCADVSSAKRHVRNAMMESNAAIVLDGIV